MDESDWMPEAIVQAIDRVETHLERDWSLEHMADAASFSAFHFHRIFQNATGETPVAFLERLRLERAALLLLARDEPITELALDVGYRRPETFARRFRNRFGVSARDYRKRQLELWSDLGLDAGRDPLGKPGDIGVERLPERKIEVRRRVGVDEGFRLETENGVGITLDWTGITAPEHVRQDWGRTLDGRPVAEGWVRRTVGGGSYATLSAAGRGPVPPTVYQRLFVWAMAGRHRLRPGPILELLNEDRVVVYQPVQDTREG